VTAREGGTRPDRTTVEIIRLLAGLAHARHRYGERSGPAQLAAGTLRAHGGRGR
jgi:ferredoxin-thioredoxin reductase catalytic subunit